MQFTSGLYRQLLDMKQTISTWFTNAGVSSDDSAIQILFATIDHFMFHLCPSQTVYCPKKTFKKMFKQLQTDGTIDLSLQEGITCGLTYCDYLMDTAINS